MRRMNTKPLAHPPPPGLGLLALEFRAPWEFGSAIAAWPALRRAPRGDGHPVLVFPGLSANDISTVPLRRYLRSRGHATRGWGQGLNLGPRPGVLERARAELMAACETSGSKVSLVGWSLGGIYARELAKELPQHVRCVITLGTPFAAHPRSTNAWRIYQFASGRDIERETAQYELAKAPLVPTTSVYSRSDGIVAWQGSVQQADHGCIENVEVLASHIGIGLNPSAWWVVADRLAQPEAAWRPFDRHGLYGIKGLIYPDPHRPS